MHWTGRLADAFEERGRWRRLAEEDASLEMICYLEVIAGEAHYLAHDADLGLEAARRVEEITRTLGEPTNMVGYSSIIFGYAHLMAERALDAIAAARVAFEHLQRRGSAARRRGLLICGRCCGRGHHVVPPNGARQLLSHCPWRAGACTPST